jgi:hypothetical protein
MKFELKRFTIGTLKYIRVPVIKFRLGRILRLKERNVQVMYMHDL